MFRNHCALCFCIYLFVVIHCTTNTKMGAYAVHLLLGWLALVLLNLIFNSEIAAGKKSKKKERGGQVEEM
uniref:Uncharacterized protein n=1 Tax=Glossina palpalis gambiensis TaxID=67801 RepID=A0A1B0BX90_9MUSC